MRTSVVLIVSCFIISGIVFFAKSYIGANDTADKYESYNTQAVTYYDKGQYALAIEYFSKMAALLPNTESQAVAYIKMAGVFHKEGDQYNVVTYCQKAKLAYPKIVNDLRYKPCASVLNN